MDASIVIMILVLLFSVIFHEIAHGFSAYLLGDPTAKNSNRLTFNPIPHIDPVMTILVPVMLGIMTNWSFLFGGAKPVPVNPHYFKNPKQGMAITAAAGPLSNLLLILVTIVVYKLLIMSGMLEPMYGFMRLNSMDLTIPEFIIFYSILINSVLMIFNLIPIPPLDGSKILMGFLSYEAAAKYESVSRYGIFIIMGIIFIGNSTGFSLIGLLVTGPLNFFLRICFLQG